MEEKEFGIKGAHLEKLIDESYCLCIVADNDVQGYILSDNLYNGLTLESVDSYGKKLVKLKITNTESKKFFYLKLDLTEISATYPDLIQNKQVRVIRVCYYDGKKLVPIREAVPLLL